MGREARISRENFKSGAKAEKKQQIVYSFIELMKIASARMGFTTKKKVTREQ